MLCTYLNLSLTRGPNLKKLRRRQIDRFLAIGRRSAILTASHYSVQILISRSGSDNKFEKAESQSWLHLLSKMQLLAAPMTIDCILCCVDSIYAPCCLLSSIDCVLCRVDSIYAPCYLLSSIDCMLCRVDSIYALYYLLSSINLHKVSF